jgi:uncharacterized protein
MQRIDGRFVYAASDLNNFLECEHLTELDRLVALGELAPPQRDDAQAELIARKGDEHERRHLAALREHPAGVTELLRPAHSLDGFEAAAQETIAAMERGDALIYQGTFFDGEFLGHPDFMRRIEVPCERWAWSYEVIDTKLALSTKPYFIIQLCNYSEHLARIQGTMPEYGNVILGNGEEKRYRLNDYSAYYRHLKQRFLERAAVLCHPEVSKDPELVEGRTYPHKNSHCQICKWHDVCAAQRKADDHLSLVARMRRDQIGKLNVSDIQTVVDLAAARDDDRPTGLNTDTFVKLRRQATMQIRGRTEGPVYELLEHAPFEGFGLMPMPDEGDVFFDMEGDPLYEPSRGLEYLFGVWLTDGAYKAFWALDRAEEKRAFEQFVDYITERRRRYPNMHVYHYADYEKSALRRLAQAHGTREQEVDDLLRGEVLVDLYAVVRQSLVISEDSYSIKRLEKFYNFKRNTEVRKGDDSIVMFETWLADRSQRQILEDIERYNEDDCRSTLLLRDWLLERREEAIAQFGNEIPFHEQKLICHPEAIDGRPVEGCRKCADRVKAEREAKQTTELQKRLLEGILTPQSEDEYALMSEDHRARYLLANLLAYRRREEKPVWWAFFDRCENVDNLLEFDKDAIAGLTFCQDVEPVREQRSWLYTYTFPDQHYKLSTGDTVYDPDTGIDKAAGSIFALDDDANRLTLKSTWPIDDVRKIRALIPGGPLRTDEQKASLVRIAESYLAGTLSRATLDLLLSRDPRCHGVEGCIQPDVVTPASVSAVAQSLDNSYLFIQGPPGTGKTYTGSRVICDLLAAKKRVAVMSNGHKAIHNLLHKVEDCARERGFSFAGRYKYTKGNGDSEYVSQLAMPLITSYADNEDLERDDYQLAAGTAWLFSREALTGKFDYLFIDEAGQVSLADAIAVSTAAKNVVLLGDPLQLAQVSQGTHPLHAGASVLEHLLADAQTVPEHRGVFLDVSYRMHPDICDFISHAMYNSRLHSAPNTANQAADGEQGLRYIPVIHEGNRRESIEEAQLIVSEIARLLQRSVTDADGTTRPMRPSDIIVVTPYNAQRRLIANLLRDAQIDVRVGTVDKFQGQEAFVVFYSLATSSGNDIPRDVGFLFEQNRFNVAMTRARALSVIVCSPLLLDTTCRKAEQMVLVNLLCRFAEVCELSACISRQAGPRSNSSTPEASARTL